MALRLLSFEVVRHKQAFQNPHQNALKSVGDTTLLPGGEAGGLGMNGLLWLMSIILYSFCLLSQADVFVLCVLMYIYLTFFAVES